MCVLMICIIQALRFQNDRIHGLFKFVIMTNYDFDEIALTKTIDFTAFLKMNCIRIPPSALHSFIGNLDSSRDFDEAFFSCTKGIRDISFL